MIKSTAQTAPAIATNQTTRQPQARGKMAENEDRKTPIERMQHLGAFLDASNSGKEPANNGATMSDSLDDDDWESAEVTTTMRNLRLVPPPSSQDGGAYERPTVMRRPGGGGDPNGFGRNGPNAGMDNSETPSFSDAVSPATASAASGQNGPLDPVLVACLESPRERMTLLKFEDQIVRFIRNPREQQITFPPLSSYHRLIIHRLAQRCRLEHQSADLNAYMQQQSYDSVARVVTLVKTPYTQVPNVLLIDLSSVRNQPTVTPATAPRIMVRKRNQQASNGGRGSANTNADTKNNRSIQDRERAYAEARARIFGSDDCGATDTSSSSSSVQSSRMGSHQASGPDGTKGFRGRGGGESKRGSGGNDCDGGTKSGKDDRYGRDGKESLQSIQLAHNWKESKVLWRNREQEMNDPDFTRNHDAFRPHRGVEMGNNPYYMRYPPPPNRPQHSQQKMEYHDTQPGVGQRGFGHSNNQAFGLSGGGVRSQFSQEPGNVDTAPRAGPPSEPYRSPYSNSSPHTRQQHYAPPAPAQSFYRQDNSARLPFSRERLPDQPSGKYNEDFPPLK